MDIRGVLEQGCSGGMKEKGWVRNASLMTRRDRRLKDHDE